MKNSKYDKRKKKKNKIDNKQNRKEHKKQLKAEKKANKKANRQNQSFLKKIMRCLLILFLVCIVGVIIALSVFLYDKMSKLETTVIDKNDLEINSEVVGADFGVGYLNVALFGVDSREGELESGTLSDTIMVASLNNQTKELRLVSVYRDTMLNVGGNSYNKANAAYSFGGPTQAINMLNRNLDLNIEKYVSVDFSIMVNIVDAMGGIEIEIEDVEIPHINKYVVETARVSGVKANAITEAGVQLLDGAQAITYARIRSTAGGDFRRTDRQRYVIEKMVDKLKTCNLSTINSIIDLALPRVSTNFTAGEIAYYASAYLDFKLGSTTGFPEKYSSGTIPGLGSTVVPQTLASSVKEVHNFLFETENYTPSSTVNTLSNEISYRASEYVGGVGNSNTGYSTNSETNISNLGSDYLAGEGEGPKKFDNPEVTFE